ncbi:MAG: ATP phosphoribosyltransferase regulatory subunit, partial [Candidatus Gallimonas sp.]
IDVGHVGFFKGVLEDCGLNEAESEKVRALINAKDGLNAERILRKAGASERTLNTVLALPTLFGGAEVFDRAESLTENACARRAIAHLRKVSDLLIRMGYEDKICFDLGTVRRLSYYSGIVFSGLVKELGAPVLSGGRYDHLADDFGGKIPAVGFAIGLKRLLIGLERQGNLPPEQPLDAVVCCEVGAEELAYRTYLALAAEGKRTRLRTDYAAADASEAAEVYLAAKEGVKRV